MNDQQFLEKVERFIRVDKGGVSAYAKELGLTPAYVSMVKNGHKPPNKAIMDDMGYEKVEKVTYKKVGANQ